MNESRRFQRVSFREPLGVERNRYEEFKGATAHDLSVGGLRLRSEQFMALGTPIRTRFQLDNKQVIIMRGKVVWVQKEPYGEYYQMGVEFQDEEASLPMKRNIYDYIEKC